MLIAPLISGALLDGLGLNNGGYVAIVIYSVALILAGVLGMFLRETRGANIEIGIEKGA
jgi:hypothetical protein